MLFTFPDAPVTVIYPQALWVIKTLEVEQHDIEPQVKLLGPIGIEIKEFTLTELRQIVSNYWEGTSWPNSVPMVIRPTVEADAMACISINSPMPLPVRVISSLLEPTFTMPTLYAMSEDDGFVVTMMLASDVGLFVRYSGAWHDLVEDVVDGLSMTNVDESALDMFDQFDRAGQLVHVGAMPVTGDDEVARATPLSEGSVAEEEGGTVVATALATKDVPYLVGADDLPGAIAAAMEDPDLQWYVERRVKALGIEAELPWRDT